MVVWLSHKEGEAVDPIDAMGADLITSSIGRGLYTIEKNRLDGVGRIVTTEGLVSILKQLEFF